MLRKRYPVLLALITLTLILVPGFMVRGEGLLPVLVGIYPSAELYHTVGEINVLDTYFEAPTISIAGTFLDLESPNWIIIAELDAAWDNGYMPLSTSQLVPQARPELLSKLRTVLLMQPSGTGPRSMPVGVKTTANALLSRPCRR